RDSSLNLLPNMNQRRYLKSCNCLCICHSVPHSGTQVVFQSAVSWVLSLATLLRTLPPFLVVPTEPRTSLPYCSFRRRRLERRKGPGHSRPGAARMEGTGLPRIDVR
ncbi:hypothetical protein L914_10359, partial [Phytophthora nicotianae]